MGINFEWSDFLPERIISDSNKITQILYNIVEYILANSSVNNNFDIKVSYKADLGSLLEITIND